MNPELNLASLFRPTDVGTIRFQNRLVMAPMTRNRSPGGVPTPDVAAYYARRAGQLGMVITEGTYLAEPTSGYARAVPRLAGEGALTGWARVVEAVHGAGGRILVQLWHVGAQLQADDEVPGSGREPISASGLVAGNKSSGRAMTDNDIDRVVKSYGEAASTALRMGFDGIEIHAAHGYLIDTFFWQETNRRTDAYGGDIAGRVRFATEIVRECRRRTAPNFPIAFRFSQWKLVNYDAKLACTPRELAEYVEPLATAGVDMFDCSTRRFSAPAFVGSPLTLAGWTRRLSGRPVIAVGSVGLSTDLPGTLSGERALVLPSTIQKAAELVDSNEVDFIAVGRGILADSDWAEKVRAGRIADIEPFSRRSVEQLY